VRNTSSPHSSPHSSRLNLTVCVQCGRGLPVLRARACPAHHECAIERGWYDIGPCQYEPWWTKLLSKSADSIRAALGGMQWPLPVWHRFMHTTQCQAKSAAHFFEGSGWPFGEAVERRWSRLIQLGLRLRTSGIAVFHTVLECFHQVENWRLRVRARASPLAVLLFHVQRLRT